MELLFDYYMYEREVAGEFHSPSLHTGKTELATRYE